jgi:transglutaminase-like putative cysteine protease
MKTRLSSAVMILVIGALAFVGAFASAARSAEPDRIRQVEFTYYTTIRVGPGARRLEAWIPLPREDAYQSVSDISIDTPLRYRIVRQPSDSNSVVYLDAAAPIPVEFTVTLRFRVTRIEEAADLAKARRDLGEPRDGAFARFLGPDRLVPIDGRIAQVSASVGDANGSALQQAHALYEYVLANMRYDKSGSGWGRGDALYACDRKHGNCTDFHSLFIALARSRGIPARFTIGFPLGPPGSGEIPGYHCWAEFYSGGEWVPIDASEAWKHPALRDYYFGHLDAGRVAFTMGRDLELRPPQHGAPLNYLIYPYVEVDSRELPSSHIRNRFEYRDRDLSSGESSRRLGE